MITRNREASLEPHDAVSRTNIYLACDEMNFTWSDKEVKHFEEMWLKGMGIRHIAEKLDRDPDEVLILLIDRARNNKHIAKRKNGLLGWTV